MTEKSPSGSELPPIASAAPAEPTSSGQKTAKTAPTITRGDTVEETILQKPSKEGDALKYLEESTKKPDDSKTA